MSLKAKIEAVIYASEEPVTLAQLVGLLGVEAQAELDAMESQQQSLALAEVTGPQEPEAGDHDALNAETLGEEDGEDDTDGATSEPEASFPESGGEAVAEGTEPELQQEPPSAEASEEPTAESAPQETVSDDSTPPPASEEATKDEDPAQDDKQQAREAAADAKVRERKLRDYFRTLLDRLTAEYTNGDRGLEIREVAGGFRLATKPEYHDAVRGFVKSLKPPLKLSLQALETLAVVAYKQPVTAPEVSEIRGVDSGGVLGGLMARKLVTTAGRKQVIGRPILYKTTKEFLLRFGLKDINELPSIEEFEKMAGEFADSEAVQEEIPMEAPPRNSSEEAAGSGNSPSLDEINAAPASMHELHESVDDIISDKSYSPEGGNTEPARSHEERVRAAERFEPSAGFHTPQADGDDRPADVVDDGVKDA